MKSAGSSPYTNEEKRSLLEVQRPNSKSTHNAKLPLPTQPPHPEENNSTLLLWSFLMMTVVGLGNRIFGKLQTIPMYDYPYFCSILSTVFYVPVCFMYIFPMLMCGTSITKEQTNVPKYKFAIMGALDSISR